MKTYPPALEAMCNACEDQNASFDMKMQLSTGTSFRFGRAEPIDEAWVAISDVTEVNGKPYNGFACSIEMRVKAIAWVAEVAEIQTGADQ